MLDTVKRRLKHRMTIHRQGPEPNFFIFSTPRSGSTWLFEILATQGRFKLVNEPFNLRKPWVRETLKLGTWGSLFQHESRPLIRDYIQSFIDGRDTDYRFKRETPFTKFWHYRTERVIFKILFAGEDDLDWYRSEFGGNIIFLLRHPIPVSLSRKQLPRLNSFLSVPFCDHFSKEQLDRAHWIVESGDSFHMAVLDWCLQNTVPLRNANADWMILSYEQIVVEPEVVIANLSERFRLPRPDKLLEQVFIASRSTGMSSAEAKNVLLSQAELRKRRTWLIERWRERIDPQQEEQAFSTLELFGIDCYELGRALPIARYLLPDKQKPGED